METVDILGHIAYIFILVGMILLTQKYAFGFAFRFLGELGWVLIGFYLGLSSIWFWGILFMVTDSYGFWNWNKNAHIVGES